MSEKFSNEIILENIKRVKQDISKACEMSGRTPDSVTLLAATKTVPAETINFALDNGISTIGENRVQELLEKYDYIDKSKADIHFIGRLQTNKVKYIIDKVSMIHSVDSFKLAGEINRQAQKHGIVMNVLAEINIGMEQSKGGVMPEEALEFIKQLSELKNIKVCGLMTIPPIVKAEELLEFDAQNDTKNVSKSENDKKIYKNSDYFKKIMKIFLDISEKNIDNIYMHELSMGMSDDYESAVAQGSTIIRVGRAIFGAR